MIACEFSAYYLPNPGDGYAPIRCACVTKQKCYACRAHEQKQLSKKLQLESSHRQKRTQIHPYRARILSAIAEGKTYLAIAAELGISRSGLRLYLRRHGLVGRRGGRNVVPHAIVERYQHGEPIHQLAQELGMARSTLGMRLRKLGVRKTSTRRGSIYG